MVSIHLIFNSFWPNDAMCRHRSQSILAQVNFACCLTALHGSLHEQMLTYHQWGCGVLTQCQFHRKCSRYELVTSLLKTHLYNSILPRDNELKSRPQSEFIIISHYARPLLRKPVAAIMTSCHICPDNKQAPGHRQRPCRPLCDSKLKYVTSIMLRNIHIQTNNVREMPAGQQPVVS